MALGAGAVAVALANEADPTAANWWIARVAGAAEVRDKRWPPLRL